MGLKSKWIFPDVLFRRRNQPRRMSEAVTRSTVKSEYLHHICLGDNLIMNQSI